MALFRGVNLGCWFVLERWQIKSLFEKYDHHNSCHDEYSLCSLLGDKAETVIRKHRETYIQESDFQWLINHGINSVRIPVGHWIFKGNNHFVATPDILDKAVDWCEKYNINCFFSLHALPGHQSPAHHTGRENFFRWSKDEHFLSESLNFIEELSERYSDKKCIRGIFTVNEPDQSIPGDFLLNFYKQAYHRIRKHLHHEKTSVIISAFTESRLPEVARSMPSPDYENVMIDLHYYQCFGDWWVNLTSDQHLSAPLDNRLPQIRQYGAEDWLTIGEWSLALRTAHDWNYPVKDAGLDQDLLFRSFADNQLKAYEETRGWFFWSYKAENEPTWSFRESVERGWIPLNFR